MVDFEKEVLSKIELLFRAEKYVEALDTINAELRVPYVEKEFKIILEQKKEQLETILMLNQAETPKPLSDEEVQEYLFENKNYQEVAITFLSKSNIRHYLDLVQKYLLWDKKNKLVTSLLISICIEQQILNELKMIKDDLDVSFTPHYLEMPEDGDGVQLAIEYFERWFGNKEVSLVYMCTEVLKMESLLMLPFAIDPDESLFVSLAIVCYVLRAWGREDEFLELLHEESVAIENLPSLEIENAQKKCIIRKLLGGYCDEGNMECD